MRISTPPLLTAAVVICLTVTPTLFADDVVVHVPENSPPGQAVARLRKLLQLDAKAQVRLTDQSDAGFKITGNDRLVVAPDAKLDYETHADYRLVLIVDEPKTPDALRNRFASLVKDQTADPQAADDLSRSVRRVTLRVVVDDVSEAPQLLSGTFQLWRHTVPQPGRSLGFIVASDPDADEQLRYELLNSNEFLRIDSESGELFVQQGAQLPPVTSLNVRVQVTDGAQLQDVQTYRLRLNQLPQATSKPAATSVVAAEATPTNPIDVPPTNTAGIVPSKDNDEIIPPMAADEIAASTGPPEPPVAVDLEVQPGSTNDDAPQDADVAEQSTAPAPFPRRVAERSSLIRFLDAWSGWLVTGLAGLCVVFIIVNGVREAMLAGQDPEEHISIAELRSTPVVETDKVAQKTPREIADILTRLDAVLGKSPSPVEVAESVESTSKSGAYHEPSVDELMTQALSSAGLMPAAGGTEPPLSSTSAATAVMAEPPTRDLPSVSVVTQAAPSNVKEHPHHRSRSDAVPALERDRIEQFRQISRMTNRADIGRHHRERMRDEWMSAGLTALACLVTGSVSVFTNCFGTMSVPVGSVMFSVSAVLLMRRSLYPQIPRRRASDVRHSDPHAADL